MYICYYLSHLCTQQKILPNKVMFADKSGFNYLDCFFLYYLGFTPCKAEQPLQSMELQEKETQKD